MYELNLAIVERVVDAALQEDLLSGDITTEACIDPQARAIAHAVAGGPLVVCGGLVFQRVFTRLDAALTIESRAAEGERVEQGARLWTVRGRARPILMAERVALNFAARMCGVATYARAYVDALPAGCRVRITDTRKTTPGLRAIERYAVRVGGAHNHRDNLGAGILIKDNHIRACGGVRAAIERARSAAPHTSKITCEVESLDQLEEAIAAGAHVVLLDNMAAPLAAEAVKRTRGRALLEASGGVTLERVVDLARAGVHVISVGALTHSAPAADLSLEFE